jgi:uncharacterized protein YabE (DUF348 family)
VSEHKDEGFKVIDRRPFTAEGEIRKEVVEEQEREAKREEVKEKVAQAAAEKAAAPGAETPKKLQAFENLVRGPADGRAGDRSGGGAGVD